MTSVQTIRKTNKGPARIATQSVAGGFTLIELLVVIAVIGVLAGAVIVMINPTAQLQRARNAQRKSDLRQIADAIERYAVTNSGYPIMGNWCSTSPNTYWPTCSGTAFQSLITSGELKKFPEDPNAGKPISVCSNDPKAITYLYYSNGVDYKLMAYCSPEGSVYPTNGTCAGFADTFCDPPRATYSWSIYTPGASGW